MNRRPLLSQIIYALADPDTRRVRYIGRTTQAPGQRLRHHLAAAKRGSTKPVYDWIRNLAPQVPFLVILQEVPAERVRVDGRFESAPEAAETKWMKRFERSQLFNEIRRDTRVYRRLVNK